jgi:hypothetical protein
MWDRYRKLKSLAITLLVCAAILLMTGEPDASPRWIVGIGIATVLILAYVIEEILLMARSQGRPCSKCGYAWRMKPFHLHLLCPHCGDTR